MTTRSAVFAVLATIDAATLAVIVYFLVEGVGDGTVSATNALLWLGLVTVPVAILLLGFLLRRAGRPWLANAALSVLAVPSLLAALAIAALVASPGSFR